MTFRSSALTSMRRDRQQPVKHVLLHDGEVLVVELAVRVGFLGIAEDLAKPVGIVELSFGDVFKRLCQPQHSLYWSQWEQQERADQSHVSCPSDRPCRARSCTA